MTAVDFITNIAPHYREHLWLELVRQEKYRFQFFFGAEPRSSIRQIDFGTGSWAPFLGRLVPVANVRLKHALIWQRGIIGRAATSDARVAIILGDMHVISSWLAAALFRLRGRKVVFWGHGLSGNESRPKLFFRLLFLRLAHTNLVYGKRAKHLLVQNGFSDERVRVIFNSLAYEKQRSLRYSSIDTGFYRKAGWFKNVNLPTVIFVGRLTPQKKLHKLIEALATPCVSGPKFNLIVVGDGPERAMLEFLATELSDEIHFFGPCYDEEVLAKLISNADLCVSPGEVGLTAIHALSYGTPVCTHREYPKQMPEVEAIVEGSTGTFFDSRSDNVSKCIEDWFDEKPDREQVRLACYRVIDKNYNPKAQIDILKETLAGLGL